jgi:hypothetical protein
MNASLLSLSALNEAFMALCPPADTYGTDNTALTASRGNTR